MVEASYTTTSSNSDNKTLKPDNKTSDGRGTGSPMPGPSSRQEVTLQGQLVTSRGHTRDIPDVAELIQAISQEGGEARVLQRTEGISDDIIAQIDQEITKSLEQALGLVDFDQFSSAAGNKPLKKDKQTTKSKIPNILQKNFKTRRKGLVDSEDVKSMSDSEIITPKFAQRKKGKPVDKVNEPKAFAWKTEPLSRDHAKASTQHGADVGVGSKGAPTSALPSEHKMEGEPFRMVLSY